MRFKPFSIPKTALSLALALVLPPLHAADGTMESPVRANAPAELSLGRVDELVAARNRELIAARRATQAGEAGVEMALARPNPTVSINASGFNRPPRNGNRRIDNTLSVDQPIERGGKRDLRYTVASSLLEANRADELDGLRQQRLLARQAYFDLKAAEESAQFSAESARMARQVLTKAQLRLKAGDISLAEVARIQTDTLKAESDATQAAIELQRSRLALARLIAMEANAERLSTCDPWPSLSTLPDAAAEIEQRPDIRAARQRVQATETGIDLARSQQVRDVSVGVQLERSPDDVGRVIYGVGVSFPLFTGYDYRGEIRRAHVDRDSASDELERLKANATAEVGQAAFEARRLSERAQSLRDQALPAARRANAAVQLAFTHGAASALDVIDARRSLLAIETDTSRALADAAKARAAWAAAVNRPDLP